MAAVASARAAIDRFYQGELDARLRQMRGDGLTYRAIARALEHDGFDVTAETVRQWCLGLEERAS